MTYSIFLTQSAVDDFLVLPRVHLLAYANWIRRELETNPNKAGVQLRGPLLQTFRAINRPGRLMVVFAVNEDNNEVMILLVIPGQQSLASREAEIVALEQGPPKLPQRKSLSDWTNLISS